MNILGLSAYYHDSAAALIRDGQVVAATQEERFSRKKNDPGFPQEAIRYCLQEGRIGLNEVDAVVFYDKPFLKFERILQTALENAPRGFRFFLISMPIWLKEKLLLKTEIKKRLKETAGEKLHVPLLFSGHHLSHAASAFYASPFTEAAILTIDGVGEWATASIAYGKGKEITLLQELHFPHSLGLFYAAVTSFLGFRVNEGEYKVMGLAPYADPDGERTHKYYRLLTENVITLYNDGSLRLNADYFSFEYAERMVPVKKWEALLGLPSRLPDAPLEKAHAELALALQRITEKVVTDMATYAQKITGSRNLCMAGGVALNCVANGKLLASKRFDHIYIQPAAGDSGAALGAALAAYHLHFGHERDPQADFMKLGALGPRFTDTDIEKAIHKSGLAAEKPGTDELLERTARFLQEGKVVGWFCGRSEFGPRALGYRSILADAGREDMQRILNLKIKKRESFRPFAPIMLEEDLKTFFGNVPPNPYMLFVHPLKPEMRFTRPAHFYSLPFADMLAIPGSPLPAITHVDYSARIQTVPAGSPARIRQLLLAYKKLTGKGILINTSFNVKDEPIVCNPDDAIRCYLTTEMDVLVMENYLITKKQPQITTTLHLKKYFW